MGVGKTLIGLRDMARLLADSQLAGSTTKLFLVAAPTQAILDSWPQEARKFGLAHLLDRMEFTTYRSLSKTLGSGRYHKLYLDECHALKESHEASLKAHVAQQSSILGLTGTPPAQANSEKGRLVTTFCPMLIDYTTDEAVLAGLLNDYRLVVHRLSLSSVRDYVVAFQSRSQFTTSERESYQYWSTRLANAEQDKLSVEALQQLRMQALIHYPTKGRYMAASSRKRCCSLPATSSRPSNRLLTRIIPKIGTAKPTWPSLTRARFSVWPAWPSFRRALTSRTCA